ncbi:metal-dependent hydrolase [Aneurinibacillus danicus]|uniref:metal-dependent hydrolase n=1 Tax=Aneurinibacillus danicus TaxID=267746 RepID=UPI0011BDB917|nr:metal-dependent hydrolase [Aneurinibacillus danicus]
MKYSTHIATSLLFGYGIASLLSAPLSAAYYGGVVLGSLLPDIDHPNSYIGRRSFGLANIIHDLCGHRGITHSLIMWILVFLPALWFYPTLFMFGLTIGYLGHILGDSFSVSGVPLLYPLTKKKFPAPITYRTGSFEEILIFIIACILLLWIMYSNLQYLLPTL